MPGSYMIGADTVTEVEEIENSWIKYGSTMTEYEPQFGLFSVFDQTIDWLGPRILTTIESDEN